MSQRNKRTYSPPKVLSGAGVRIVAPEELFSTCPPISPETSAGSTPRPTEAERASPAELESNPSPSPKLPYSAPRYRLSEPGRRAPEPEPGPDRTVPAPLFLHEVEEQRLPWSG